MMKNQIVCIVMDFYGPATFQLYAKTISIPHLFHILTPLLLTNQLLHSFLLIPLHSFLTDTPTYHLDSVVGSSILYF